MCDQELQALEKSCGGLSSKIHAKVDSFGMPLGFILTADQEHEIKFSEILLGKECHHLFLRPIF